MAEPKGKHREFTDKQLRDDLAAHMKPPAIATKYGVSRQAVYKRIEKLNQTTVAAAVAPEESRRFVRASVDAMEELTRGLQRANLVQDACHVWLTDANDPTKYDVGPRASEVLVTYTVQVETSRGYRTEQRKKPLSHLLRLVGEIDDESVFGELIGTESKHSDPRELILATIRENRAQLTTMAELAKMLADARVMQELREIMLEEIAAVSPEVASAIEERLRRRLVVCGAFRRPEALPDGG